MSCLVESGYRALLHCHVCCSNALHWSLEIGCCMLDKISISIFLIAFLCFHLLQLSPVCYSLVFSSMTMYAKVRCSLRLLDSENKLQTWKGSKKIVSQPRTISYLHWHWKFIDLYMIWLVDVAECQNDFMEVLSREILFEPTWNKTPEVFLGYKPQ